MLSHYKSHIAHLQFTAFGLQGLPAVPLKNLLMPLFLMGCFPRDFQEGKQPIKEFEETAH